MQRLFSQVIYTAKLLETESGGILVSVDKLKEGHAIIIYRGKNYKRPSGMVAKNLLTKRKALRRSLEMQRLGVRLLSVASIILLVFLGNSHPIPLYVFFCCLNFLFYSCCLLSVVSVAEVFCLSETAENL